MDLNDLVKGLLSELQKISKSDAVVGNVRDAGKAKVLPLSKISIAFGTGVAGMDGKSDREGRQGDAGLGVSAECAAGQPRPSVVGEDGVPHARLKRSKQAVLRRASDHRRRTAPQLGRPEREAR
jgi:uncharacterized spore protein YtfJ